MSETVDKMNKYIRSTPPDENPMNAAIFFLCGEIDRLKQQIEINKPSHPGSPLNSYV